MGRWRQYHGALSVSSQPELGQEAAEQVSSDAGCQLEWHLTPFSLSHTVAAEYLRGLNAWGALSQPPRTVLLHRSALCLR